MRRAWLRTFLVIALVLMYSVAAAASASRNVVVTRGTPTLDGALEDSVWRRAVWYEINEQTSNVENGAFGAYAASFALAYDNTNVYFAYKAKDAKIVGTHADSLIWEDDCLELWFNWAGARDPAQPGYYQVGLAPMTAAGTPGVWVWRAVPGADEKLRTAIQLEIQQTADGWQAEAIMPLEAFNVEAPVPINATFNISVVNRDSEGSGNDPNWNHLTWNGDDHRDANQFVRMEFR